MGWAEQESVRHACLARSRADVSADCSGTGCLHGFFVCDVHIRRRPTVAQDTSFDGIRQGWHNHCVANIQSGQRLSWNAVALPV